MCTVQLLLQTNAHVVAFEPNPINQYHLTRTLLSLARLYPSIVGRVVVYPCGIGEVRESTIGGARMLQDTCLAPKEWILSLLS